MDLHDMDALNLLTGVIYGEARGEMLTGKLAVACVIRNRVRLPCWWGEGWHGVMLQKKQFSCVNPGNPNYDDVVRACSPSRMIPDQAWRECRFAAYGAYNDWYRDITKGANHYHADTVRPDWAEIVRPTVRFGRHLFYRL